MRDASLKLLFSSTSTGPFGSHVASRGTESTGGGDRRLVVLLRLGAPGQCTSGSKFSASETRNIEGNKAQSKKIRRFVVSCTRLSSSTHYAQALEPVATAAPARAAALAAPTDVKVSAAPLLATLPVVAARDWCTCSGALSATNDGSSKTQYKTRSPSQPPLAVGPEGPRRSVPAEELQHLQA